MRHSRGPIFGIPCLKIRVYGKKLNTFTRHLRGPHFSVSRLKIHVFAHKIDILCATRADPNLEFRTLKSVFRVKN